MGGVRKTDSDSAASPKSKTPDPTLNPVYRQTFIFESARVQNNPKLKENMVLKLKISNPDLTPNLVFTKYSGTGSE